VTNFEGNGEDLILGTIPDIRLEGLRKTRTSPGWIVCVPDGIWTEYFLNKCVIRGILSNRNHNHSTAATPFSLHINYISTDKELDSALPIHRQKWNFHVVERLYWLQSVNKRPKAELHIVTFEYNRLSEDVTTHLYWIILLLCIKSTGKCIYFFSSSLLPFGA
jgi:hypothetical protein